jgi:carbamate kinase
MRVVLALGGNALLRRGEPLDADVQRRNVVDVVAAAVAPIACKHDVIITHGNGPQIGLLALQAAAHQAARPYPLDVLGAESQGMIGYLLEAAIAAALPDRDVATLLTQVEIDPADPAFARPTKPIGPLYDEADARRLKETFAWPMMRDGTAWRRAVPSPEPKRIRELHTIELLVKAGVIVVCAGGGGIPVVAAADGSIRGVEAVIDKDLAAALLAQSLEADAVLFLTDVPGVFASWPAGRSAKPISGISAAWLRRQHFAPGSMGPKVEAACRFVETTGRWAAIGAVEDAVAILAGRSGTIITPV